MCAVAGGGHVGAGSYVGAVRSTCRYTVPIAAHQGHWSGIALRRRECPCECTHSFYICFGCTQYLWKSSRGCASSLSTPRSPTSLALHTTLRSTPSPTPFLAEQLDVFAQVLRRARVRASPMCNIWYRACVRKRVYARGCTARRLAGRAPQEHVAPNVTSDSFRSIELFMQLPFAGTDVARITQGRSRVLRDSLLSLLQIIFKISFSACTLYHFRAGRLTFGEYLLSCIKVAWWCFSTVECGTRVSLVECNIFLDHPEN